METVTPIAELRSYTKAEKRKISVCRIWKSSIPTSDKKYVTFHYILMRPNVKNNAVEAYASNIDYEVVASKIQAGDCYEIMNFRTIKIRGQYKVMPHDTQLIFTNKTIL
ncbi:unnamed protein product [Malus baccata var. baccata]